MHLQEWALPPTEIVSPFHLLLLFQPSTMDIEQVLDWGMLL
jgi:hypothetical protein